jgi:hypothetical protein
VRFYYVLLLFMGITLFWSIALTVALTGPPLNEFSLLPFVETLAPPILALPNPGLVLDRAVLI